LSLSVLAVAAGGGLRAAAAWPWGLLAAAAVLDLLLSLGPRKTVSATVPPEIFVGETGEMRLTVAPPVPGMRARLDWPAGVSGPALIALDADGRARVPVAARRRGVWHLRRLWLSWPSRLGLFEFVPRPALAACLRVVPNIRLVRSGQITATVRSALYGQKENRAIGEGAEFHQLQDFVPGMDVKRIDWKRSARKRALVAKELHAERNHHVILCLDNGYLMAEEIGGVPKIDHAVTAALATAWAAAIGGDLVGYFSYDVRPRSFVAPEPGRRAFARMRAWSADLAYVRRETNHTLALTALNARTPKRALLVVFTDFVDTTSAELLIENIAVLARRHLIVFVALRDPALEGVTARPPDTLDDMARMVSADHLVQERRLVLERLQRLGVTVIDAAPGAVTGELISAYLAIKAREMI
jgi:uncharacterized protein (DUF58 family)